MAQAARRVFTSKHATVIWPTPPGTGVIAPATFNASCKGHIADQSRLAVGARQAVDADIDHGGARLDPVAAHHFRLADGGVDQVGAGAQLCEIARARMRDGHGGVFVEQQLQQQAADQIGAADHDGVHPLAAMDARSWSG